MNFGERTKGAAENVLRVGAVGAAVVGMYYGGKAYFDISHSDSTFQSSVVEQPKRDYFADFMLDDTKIALVGVQEGANFQEGKKSVGIVGKASKSPAGAVLSGQWKFNIAVGDKSYEATLAQIEEDSGDQNFPVSVVITAIVPEDLQGYRLDISYNPSLAEGQDGGVGDSTRTIPLPSLNKSPNRT